MLTNATPDTAAEDTEAVTEKRDAEYLDGAITAKHGVRAGRTFFPELDLSTVLALPEENYRWGSQEAMERDIGRVDTTHEDGFTESSYGRLRQSIARVGVQEPIGVVLRADGMYHVIFGFTRTVAAKAERLPHIPAFVYHTTISEAEVEMLQMLENARELKRRVNWVQEHDTFKELHARILNRVMVDKTIKNPAFVAAQQVCSILGKHPSSMKSRTHWLAHLDPRVVALARKGHLSCTASIEFLPGGKTNKFTPEFIGEVLEMLQVDGAYPPVMTPEYVRNAIRKVRIRAKNRISNEDGLDMRGKTPLLVRQSPAILRDVSVLLARRLLLNLKLDLGSDAKAVECVTRSQEWTMLQGLGMGAGDATIPPVLDQVEGCRDDDGIRRIQLQHERTCRKYATMAIVNAFVQNAMHSLGYKDVGYCDRGGWMMQRTQLADGQPGPLNKSVFYGAIAAAVDDPELQTLHAQVHAAWAKIRPIVKGAA